MKYLGKNKISNIKRNKEVLGFNKYYNYNYFSIKKTTYLKFSGTDLFFYILCCKDKNSKIIIGGKSAVLFQDELLRVKKKKSKEIKISTNTKVVILVVFKPSHLKNISSSNIMKIKNIYNVKKPWGYEKWLTGSTNKNYAFKKIFLKKGSKTSLQYHIKKIETNFLFSGNAKLHYMFKKIPLKKKNFLKISKSIKTKIIKNGSVINVNPKTIHRLEAISDLMLFEVSSPHLSDVVRVSDVTNRPDGKIKNEHSKKLN